MGNGKVLKASWNDTAGRYELKRGNTVIAYTEGATKADHDASFGDLCKVGIDKGYTIISAD